MAIAAACVGEHVSETEQPTITVLSTQNYTFADQFVGTTSSPHTVTISPASGQQSDTVSSIVMTCSDFSLTNVPTLPAVVNSTCQSVDGSGDCTGYKTTSVSFAALFSPLASTASAVSCTVYVTLNNDVPNATCNTSGNHQCVTLLGRGVEPAIRLTASPALLDFGDVRVGDTATSMVTVTNHGSDSGGDPVTGVTISPNPPYTGMGSLAAHTIPYNGGADQDQISCAPTMLVAGGIAGTMAVTGTQSLSVGLKCNPIMSSLAIKDAGGVSTSIATLAGTQPDGSTRVGEPVDVTMTLLNDPAVSTATLTIHGVTLIAPNNATLSPDLSITSSPPANTTLAIGQSATVTIHYAATTAIAKGVLGAMSIDVDSGPARTANILGGAVDTSMSLSGDGDLGPICAGITTSKMIEVQKNNVGTFLVTAISQPAAPFAVSGGLPTPGTPISVTGTSNTVSDQVTISAMPTTVGDLAASFTITTDIPHLAPLEIDLKATALAAGVAPTPRDDRLRCRSGRCDVRRADDHDQQLQRDAADARQCADHRHRPRRVRDRRSAGLGDGRTGCRSDLSPHHRAETKWRTHGHADDHR